MKCDTCYHFVKPDCTNPKNESGELIENCPYYLSDEYLEEE
jgi:hypothetical protein